MADFVFEFLFQAVFELVGELLLEFGFKGAAAVVRSRVGRLVTAALAGFGAGVWWGHRLTVIGQADRPRLFWVSVVVGAVAALAAFVRWRSEATFGSTRSQGGEPGVLAWPWHWPAYRLAGFAVLNAAVAAGIATGWEPPAVLR